VPNIGLVLIGLALALPVAAERSSQVVPAKSVATAERRLALVIGNSAYKASPLRNPTRDARDISRALSDTGFQVQLIEDATLTTMRRAIRAFGDQLRDGGVGLFYYAGHGVQVRGSNYLLPVNADIEREDEIEDQGVDVNLMLSKMDTAKNKLNIVILDACRNNPFPRFRSVGQGLAQIDAPTGTIIAFATAPGRIAMDGDGDNGLYTSHLLRYIREPGLPLEQLFKQVRIGVAGATRDRQVPWESSSLKGDFYFLPPDPSRVAAVPKAVVDVAVSEAVKAERERAAVERSKLEAEMRALVEQLRRRQQAEIEEEAKKRANSSSVIAAKAATPPAEKPVVMAAVAPRPQPALEADPQMPKPGDSWQYRTRTLDQVNKLPSEWVSRNLVEVKTVVDRSVVEIQTRPNGTRFDILREPGLPLVTLNAPNYMLSPYLHLQQPIKVGTQWPELPMLNAGNCSVNPTYRCKFSAKVTALERVTVPAGTFEAFRIEVTQFTSHSGSMTGPIEREGIFWFAPQAKRYIKIQWRTVRGLWSDRDSDVELAVLKLI